jgi:hypothetical protein
MDDEAVGGGRIGTVGGGSPGGGSSAGGSAAQVKPGAPTVSGAVSPEVIRRVVRAHLGKFKLCWEKSGGGAELRVTLALEISAAGKVTSARAGGAEGALASCIAAAARTMSFPASTGAAKVSYPLVFTPAP